MAASTTVASSSTDAVFAEPSRCWHFSKEQMRKAASFKDGFDEKKELLYRQQAARFIQSMGERLNHGMKETRLKISQLCMCSAMIHMHRFFYFHSFKMFDYRDLAAASLFLAGKSEECPRKLEHIVKVWWSLKYPKFSTIPPRYYHDAAQLIVMLENVVLQTIAFDLKIELPHPIVLGQMHRISRGNKKLTEVAYFFATDVLCVTNWAIRLTAPQIAAVCIYIVCLWANHQIPPEGDHAWFRFAGITMDKLEEMAQEFVTIYESCKDMLQLTKFVHKGYIQQPKMANSPRPVGDQTSTPSGNLLPPPPQPPTIQTKINLAEYKNRTPASDARQSIHATPVSKPSFMPDISISTPLTTNGDDRERHHKHHKEKKEHKHKKDKEHREHRDKERPKEKDEEKERRREERKRERESENRGLNNSASSAHLHPSSEKRPRLDVPSGVQTSTPRVGISSVQIPPGLPSQAPWRPAPPSASKLIPNGSFRQDIQSTVPISSPLSHSLPPPPPPPSTKDLEDGELS